MSTGIQMLLKTFGLDAEKIEKAIADIAQIGVGLKQQLDRIEMQIAAIEQKLEVSNDNRNIAQIGNSAAETDDAAK